MIDQISSLISDLGLNCSALDEHSVIGEQDVGLDSQEIVELTCMLEERFEVKLPPQFLSKNSTVGELIGIVQEAQVRSVRTSHFEGECEASLLIHASPGLVYDAIYKMREWCEKLPHVKEIEVLYDDGVYQEFLMGVASDGGLVKVRSIRRCKAESSILFFQPDPPSFLEVHCGGWRFQKDPEGCLVTTWHRWKPKRSLSEAKSFSNEEIEGILLSHAELALDTWKKNLEDDT